MIGFKGSFIEIFLSCGIAALPYPLTYPLPHRLFCGIKEKK